MIQNTIDILELSGEFIGIGFVLTAIPALFGIFINFALNLFRK